MLADPSGHDYPVLLVVDQVVRLIIRDVDQGAVGMSLHPVRAGAGIPDIPRALAGMETEDVLLRPRIVLQDQEATDIATAV